MIVGIHSTSLIRWLHVVSALYQITYMSAVQDSKDATNNIPSKMLISPTASHSNKMLLRRCFLKKTQFYLGIYLF